MADLSTMSDAELRALYQQTPAAPPPAEAATAPPLKNLGEMSDDELRAAHRAAGAVPAGSVWENIKSIPGGMVQGFGSAASAAGQAAQAEMGQPIDVPGGEETAHILEKNVTGELPRTGAYGRTVGEWLGNPGTWVGPGGLAGKAVTAVAGGLGSEGAGQLTKGTWAEPYARFLGGVAGGFAPTAAARTITPNVMSAEQRAMVQALENEGVTSMTAGQRVDSLPLKWMESVAADIPFSGKTAEGMRTATSEQFTRAAMRRVGVDAPRATPEVIDGAFNQIGTRFNELTSRNTMQLDRTLQNELLDTAVHYQRMVNPMARAPVVEETMNDIAKWAGQQGGVLDGRQYQNLRSRIGDQARATKSDPQLSHALSDISESLDNAMERSIAATNPRDVGAFGEARRQWRNMLVIERAATGTGKETAHGLLSPTQLETAERAVIGRRAQARGRGDFSELARSGEAVLKPLPQSGTGPRENVLHLFQLANVLGGEHVAGLGGAFGGFATGVGGPALAARTLLSPPMQSYLSNQLLPHRPGTSPTMMAIINALQQQPAQQ